ncbi:MAG: DUF5522 domain-containing protein [Cyclobacteriaceae bacterium]
MSSDHKRNNDSGESPKLTAEDYYVTDEGLWVFTEHYHLKRGYCCRSGCRHCPYGFKRSSGRKTD